MKIAILGGYGNISWWCTKEAIENGHDVYIINRQETTKTRRIPPYNVKTIIAEYRNKEEMERLLAEHTFDVVCDFICYTEEQANNAIELFTEKTKQYIFISSEAIYDRRKNTGPFTEKSIKYNENNVHGYISNKIKAENAFIKAYEENSFPVTIVRPGFTYDTIIPNFAMATCFTLFSKCIKLLPWIVLGSGENVWTFTHSSDFAKAFIMLFGNSNAVGEDFILTTNVVHSWNEASRIILEQCNARDTRILHIPYTESLLEEVYPSKELIYHTATDSVFDTSKIQKICPLWKEEVSIEEGIARSFIWLREKEERQRLVQGVEDAYNKIIKKYESI